MKLYYRVPFTLLVLGVSCTVAANSSETQVFDVVQAKSASPSDTESGGFIPGGVEFRGTSLLRLLAAAYSLPSDRIVGGPEWIDQDRFNISARSPNASPEALRTMLQNLLKERFRLDAEAKEVPLPVYVLTDIGARRTKSASSIEASECRKGNEENFLTLTCRGTTLSELANALPSFAPAYFDIPVIDRTGLASRYDFQLRWVGRRQLPGGEDGLRRSGSLFTSINKELGVNITLSDVPALALKVNAASRLSPTETSKGSPGIHEELPSEFEVADIHKCHADAPTRITTDFGRFDARCISLKNLIEIAYNKDRIFIVGGPKWLENEKFDVLAKTAPTESIDTLRLLLRRLLADRFRLKTHTAQEPVTVYALLAVKPKLEPSKAGTRQNCKVNRRNGTQNYDCINTTIKMLAEHLREIAPGYIDLPVIDFTGVEGSFDFNLSWTPRGQMAAAEQADGSGIGRDGVTIFDAITKQLGLKVVTEKHALPVIVIDDIARQPSEN